MITLFIDTHEKKIIIAILKDEKIISQKIVDEQLNHSRICLPTIIEVLKGSNVTCQDLSDIVVVNGPGSFTGERLGVTIAKTLAYTLNIPIRTMTSLETTLADVILKQDSFLALEEKNGYFIAQFNSLKELISDYIYLTKEEFNNFKEIKEIIYAGNYDVSWSVKYAHQKKPINPHQVNPFYVKKIEVEK